MSQEDFAKFREGRLAAMLGFYDQRAAAAKRGHNISSIYILVVSIALGPLQALNLSVSGFALGRVLVMVFSPTVALAAGVAAHFRFHENWLSYRLTWDTLMHELSLHDAQAGPYRNNPDCNALFVERFEAIVSNEGKDFYSRLGSKNLTGHHKAGGAREMAGSTVQ